MAALRLIADIGGTNARLALLPLGEVAPEISPQRYPVAEFASFEECAAAFLRHQGAQAPAECLIAAAGPKEDGRISLTNAHWRIAERDVTTALGATTRLFNDLEAVALALAHLAGADLVAVRPGTEQQGAPRLAVNVGTGFGGAVAIPLPGGGWTALPTEPGHMRLAGDSGADFIEDVLSGPGLARLRVSGRADPREHFSTLLGGAVRDLVLASGSWGGAFLCGGVLDAWEETVAPAAFLHGYSAPGGAMATRLDAVPIHRITAAFPALLGLSRVPSAHLGEAIA